MNLKFIFDRRISNKTIRGIIKSFWSKYKQRELKKVNRVREKYNFSLLLIFSYNVNAITLKVNEGNAPGSPEALALGEFKKIVEEQSKGEIKIRIFLHRQLGNPQESLENLMTGALDLYSGALSYYATLLPDELNPVSLMYFFKDTEHLKRYLRGSTNSIFIFSGNPPTL